MTVLNPRKNSNQWWFALMLLMLLGGCAGPSLKEDILRDPPSYASPPASTGILATMANEIRQQHGPDNSGFKVLDGSFDALYWRLALIDSASSSLDIQTYLWYPDNTGRLILERAVLAADRGVRVRLLVDDLLTIGRDQLIRELDERPNIEVRLFNPWSGRGTMSRAGEMIAEFERLRPAVDFAQDVEQRRLPGLHTTMRSNGSTRVCTIS